MNKVVGIALGAGLLYGVIRLLKMQNVSDQSTIKMVNPRIHSINLGGLSFRTEVAVNNPSKDQIKITKPVVTLMSKNTMLAQSAAENKEIIIQPLNVTQIDTIELQLPWTTMAGLIKNIITKVPAVITAWKSGNKKNLVEQLGVPIEMHFTTYVNGLFYQSPSEKLI
jgi:hypothetical protein